MAATPPLTELLVYGSFDGKHQFVIGRVGATIAGGTFQYSPSFLSSAHAFAIDPINLPLDSRLFTTERKVFGVLADAGPDEWGRRVIGAVHARRGTPGILTPLELLLHGSGRGSGMLFFRGTGDAPESGEALRLSAKGPTVDDLLTLQTAAELLEAGKADDLSDQARDFLEAGSSLGGARPKALVRDVEGVEWIAKLGRAGDVFNKATVEHATLELARDAGINVPESKVVSIDEARQALLVRRFDRVWAANQSRRLHYISAFSLWNGVRITTQDYAGKVSYVGLADMARRFVSRPAETAADIYSRMIFNVLMANRDDHLQNHGYLYDPARSEYRLSPAFDLLPHPERGYHAIGIGGSGTELNLRQAIELWPRFRIPREVADERVERIFTACSDWKQRFAARGVAGQDIDLLSATLPIEAPDSIDPELARATATRAARSSSRP